MGSSGNSGITSSQRDYHGVRTHDSIYLCQTILLGGLGTWMIRGLNDT